MNELMTIGEAVDMSIARAEAEMKAGRRVLSLEFPVPGEINILEELEKHLIEAVDAMIEASGSLESSTESAVSLQKLLRDMESSSVKRKAGVTTACAAFLVRKAGKIPTSNKLASIHCQCLVLVRPACSMPSPQPRRDPPRPSTRQPSPRALKSRCGRRSKQPAHLQPCRGPTVRGTVG